MDNSNMSKNKQNDYLGVNKNGKNIRKSPLHKPNFVHSNPDRQQSQPQVYNISKNDFRSIVQQLTGSPSRHDPLPRPPIIPPKNPSMRLQRIRPPPLMPIHRPLMPPVVAPQSQGPPMAPNQARYFDNNNFARPPPQLGQPSPRGMHQFAPGEASWARPALSPISAYMHQLQNCIGEGGQTPGQQQMQPQIPGQGPAQHHMHQQVHGYMGAQTHHVPGQVQAQGPGPFQGQHPMHPQGPGHVQAQHSMHPQGPEPFQGQHPMHPQGPGHVQAQHSMHPQGPGNFQAQSPSSGLLQNPSVPPLPSPGTNGTGLLPSPSSQFCLPPGGYFNSLSPTPRSPYPLLSPGSQFPPPLSPNFAFSPFGQPGNFGPLSPGISFPLSPSGFFPILSPRWRDQ